ncbi:hypothetical protein DFP73DRAFT_566208 [Morchella snyderi]|nr:hypothetical protein DFP73DRAFT_566208 [Morchella snyderi]
MEAFYVVPVVFSLASLAVSTTRFAKIIMEAEDPRVDLICARLLTENARTAEWGSRMKVNTSDEAKNLWENFPDERQVAIRDTWYSLQRWSREAGEKFGQLKEYGLSQSAAGNRRFETKLGRAKWEMSLFKELSVLIDTWEGLNDCLERLTQAPPGYQFTRQVENLIATNGHRVAANVPERSMEVTHETVSNEVDYQEASNTQVMIKTLYLNCRYVLYLLCPRGDPHKHPVFKEVAMRLKLWGSGLFEGGTVRLSSSGLQPDRADPIDLDHMLNPTLSRSVPLRKAILGIFSDIARTLEFMLRPYDNRNRHEFSIARIQLLIELGNEEMTVETLEEPYFTDNDPQDVVDICGEELKASVGCLFDLLPTIRRLHHLHLLEREISGETVINEQPVNVVIDAEQDLELETDDKSKGQIRKLVEYDLTMASTIQKTLTEEKEVNANPKLAAEFEYAVNRLSTWHRDVGTKIDKQITEENHELVRAMNSVFCRLAYCFGQYRFIWI